MPKSCLLVFPHCERKRQNSPFEIGTFHFRFFFSSLPLRFNISYLPTFLFAHYSHFLKKGTTLSLGCTM